MTSMMKEGEILHADGCDGNDYTLCGAAIEGVNGDEQMESVKDRHQVGNRDGKEKHRHKDSTRPKAVNTH